MGERERRGASGKRQAASGAMQTRRLESAKERELERRREQRSWKKL